jgi:hypothetical protein
LKASMVKPTNCCAASCCSLVGDATMFPLCAANRPLTGRFSEYRARPEAPQSEKTYTKTTSWLLAARDVGRQALHVIGRGGALWISRGRVPA